MHKIVFVGNCQAAALAWTYNEYIASDPAWKAEAFDGRSLSSDAKTAIAAATTLVVQVADLNEEALREFDNTGSRVIRFPYISGSFIWPFGTEGHIRGRQPPLGEFGVFSDEMGGDRFLNDLFRAGADPQRAVEVYLSLDIVSIGKVGQRFDLSQRMQRVRDERSGIEIASYIESSLSRERLFATRGHPFSGLFLQLAVPLFDQLGASSQAISEMKSGLQPGPLEQECIPIHPGVTRHFGLVPLRNDGKFLLNMVIQSLEEYIVRYMLQDCDADLMRGRRLAQSGQHGQAVEFLSRGLERSPRSPEAARLLSHSLQHLNRKQESLAAAEQAVRIDPTDLQNLTHLAQFYLFLGDNESAISTLAILLQLHPNSPDGQRMIASAQKALLVRP